MPYGYDAVLAFQDSHFPKPVYYQRNYELLQRAKELGIDVSNINLNISDKVEADDLSDALGTFLLPNTITIKSGLSPHAERQILAHEYLHYLWSTQDHQDNLQSYIDASVNDPWLKEVLSSYTNCDRECIADEAHSYSCSTEPLEYLSQEFNNYCNSLIPNRQILFQ